MTSSGFSFSAMIGLNIPLSMTGLGTIINVLINYPGTNAAVVLGEDVEFAILRIANSKGEDASFEHNYAGCIANDIDAGAYRYSYALTVPQAIAEAQEVLEILRGRSLPMGVWLDLEWDRQRTLGKGTITRIAREWMRVITDGGYECGIYCNLDWYRNVINVWELPSRYWIARYPANDAGCMRDSLRPNAGEAGWQYSSKGRVPGINGNVDMNVWYDAANGGTGGTAKGNPYKEPGYTLYRHRLLQSKEHVKWLQWELTQAGGHEIAVDGIFGRATEAALRNTQGVLGIAVDGKCGPVTRERLKKA